MRIIIRSNNRNYEFVSIKFNRLNWEAYFDVAKTLIDDEEFVYNKNVKCKIIDRELGRTFIGDSSEVINYIIEFGSKVLHFVIDNEEVA